MLGILRIHPIAQDEITLYGAIYYNNAIRATRPLE